MPGAGAPIRDANGRVVAHGRHTLVKDKSGGNFTLYINKKTYRRSFI